MSGKYALVIGNSEYQDARLAKLTAPGRDAEDLARVLREKDFCGFDDVRVLLNQTEPVVREAIDEFFDTKTHDDLLVLYFSGHGVRDEQGALYLAVQNTNRSRLRSTAVKSDFIHEAMEQSRARRQVLILDCCNSGAFEQGTKAATGGSLGIANAFGGYGRVILTASDSLQYAWQGDAVIGSTDNSLFTHFLVEGLKGEAEVDGDGIITVDELYDYAYEQVRRATPNQTPSKFSSKQEGEIVLRQITRIDQVRPMPLPSALTDSLDNPLSAVRLGAVQELGRLVTGKNLGLARSAREALEQLCVQDDSLSVRKAANDVLAPIIAAEQEASAKAAEQNAAAERAAQQEALAPLGQAAKAKAAPAMQPGITWHGSKSVQPEMKEAVRDVEAAHAKFARQLLGRLEAPLKRRPAAQDVTTARPLAVPRWLSVLWVVLGSAASGAILTGIVEWSSSTSKREAAITVGLCGLCIGFSIALGWLLDRTVTRWRSLLAVVGGWAVIWAAAGIVAVMAIRNSTPEQIAGLLTVTWAFGGLITGIILRVEHVLPSWGGVGLVTLGCGLGGLAATLLTALAAPGISSAGEAMLPFMVSEGLAGAIGAAIMVWLLQRTRAAVS